MVEKVGHIRSRIGLAAVIVRHVPPIIHIPLSGGDRKAKAKGIRYAHGLHNSAYRELVLLRSAAEAEIGEADRLECEAWNAIMWAGGPAMPSPRDPSCGQRSHF